MSNPDARTPQRSIEQAFDAYDATYTSVVQDSVAYSGLAYDFFLRSKANLVAELIADHLPHRPAPEMLDVGCGVGALHPLLAPLCGKLSGADISATCIGQAERDNPGVAYRSYQGGRLPYDDNEFDMVVAVCVVHHVPPADRVAFVREMKRVARPGGLVCIIEHNPFNPLTRLSVLRCPFDADAVLLSCGKARRLLAEAGLMTPASRYFVFVPSTRRWASWTERRLARLPLGAQYAAFARA